MPHTASSLRRHIALRWIIRGTGLLIAISSALLTIIGAITLVMFGVAALFHSDAKHWISLLFLLPLVAFGTAFFLAGFCMFRKIDSVTVANFASIFALLLARVWYYSLPTHLPSTIASYLGDGPPFFAHGKHPQEISYRPVLSFIAFYLFYRLIKSYLHEILGLNPRPIPSSNSDPDIPEFPEKSPLIQL